MRNARHSTGLDPQTDLAFSDRVGFGFKKKIRYQFISTELMFHFLEIYNHFFALNSIQLQLVVGIVHFSTSVTALCILV
jgi:hypothetical protein